MRTASICLSLMLLAIAVPTSPACGNDSEVDQLNDGGSHDGGLYADASGDAFITDATPVDGQSPAPGIYGSGIGGDGLANTVCGHMSVSATKKQSMRFRAGQSSSLATARYYYIGPDGGKNVPGYAGGTGGSKRFTIETDDGTSNHLPTGSILATLDVGPEGTSNAGNVISFDPAPALTAGTIYHLVIENTDAVPEVNYFSPDYWYYAEPSLFDARYNPKYANSDWAHLMLQSGAWTERKGYAPILDLGYSNGAHEGMGYMELSYSGSEIGNISGANDMSREAITVSGADRVVTGAGVRVYRSSGSEPLTVRLDDGTGAAIDFFTIAASEIPVGASQYGDEAKWVKGNFSQARTLVSGGKYALRLSTGATTIYKAFVIRRGSHGYGYHASTVFLDGNGQQTNNGGSSWFSLGRAADENNVQSFFVTK